VAFRALIDGRPVCGVQADGALEHVHQVLDLGIDLAKENGAIGFGPKTFSSKTFYSKMFCSKAFCSKMFCSKKFSSKTFSSKTFCLKNI
jgi:hypothetical protein